MSEERTCKTPGVIYRVVILPWLIRSNALMPENFDLMVTEEQAKEIENKIHDALEEILAPYFANKQPEALS